MPALMPQSVAFLAFAAATAAATATATAQDSEALSCSTSQGACPAARTEAQGGGVALIQSKKTIQKVQGSTLAQSEVDAVTAAADDDLEECEMDCTRYFGGAMADTNPVCQSSKGSCGGKLKLSGKCPARYTKCNQKGSASERDEIEWDNEDDNDFDDFDDDLEVGSFGPLGGAAELQPVTTQPPYPKCGQPCTRYFGGASPASVGVCQSAKGKCGGFLKLSGKCPARYTVCMP